VALVGCTRVADLEENLAAAGLSLSFTQLAELVDTLPDAVGERYDAGGVRTVGL
jgi:aryl-alcohol dehydrogenase-like predicted oxidoreductase